MGSSTVPRVPAPGLWLLLWLRAFVCGVLLVASTGDTKVTDPKELQALLAFKAGLDDPDGNLESWVETSDPCGEWKWVLCEDDITPDDVDSNFRHVTSLRLLNLNLGGQLHDDLANLPALTYFDVMRNQLNGSIPAALGQLIHLENLLLSGNQFSGVLPSELGNLTKLLRLQVDENRISGQIPTSFFNIVGIWHLHMNNNSLNGSIPPGLGKLPYLLHVLLDNNDLSGTLPDDLASAPNLTVIQLDNNKFDEIPAAYTRIPRLRKLSMRNCSLRGPLPNFNMSTSLAVLDLSRNSFTGPLPTSGLPVNITSVDLSYNDLQGPVPASFGDLQNLGYLELSNNNLSGEIAANLGLGRSFNDSQRVILDFQNNSLELASGSVLSTVYSEPNHDVQVWLSGNPSICPPNSQNTNPLCVPHSIDSFLTLDLPQPQSNWGCGPCPLPKQLVPPPSSSPDTCRCAVPIIVSYRLKSPPFVIFDVYETEFRQTMADELGLSPDQIGINSTEFEAGPRIKLSLFIFPSDADFNKSEIFRIAGEFYDWELAEHPDFGPYEILGVITPAASTSGSKGHSVGLIAGIVCAAVVLTALLSALVIRFWLRRRGYGRLSGRKCARQINVPGVRSFTFGEIAKATSSFREENLVGRGGYGNVYFGTLNDGQKVAVKRAEVGSLQGSTEFENEIQLLSRVHHRNLVGLVGYCSDGGEQMLVYEFVCNGDLREHLAAAGQPPLDIRQRLRIAIGAARGIQYLHTQADPPIFHRDIKAANILLDGKYNAKVSDFGLSRLAMADADLEGVHTGHITTVVKGTPGYLDPEYFLTRKLTDKSDVYSFGVVLMELISGLRPIVSGKNLTREMSSAYKEGEVMRIIDPKMVLKSVETIDPLIKLALSCTDNDTESRPSMTEVLHALEEIWRDTVWSDGAFSPSKAYLGDDKSGKLRDGGGPNDASGKQRLLSMSSRNRSPLSPGGPALYNCTSMDAMMKHGVLDISPR